MKATIGVILALITVAAATAAAQDQTATHKHLMKEDSAAFNALIMYPDTIRLDIFEASQYPSSIVSIASLQKNSSQEFVELIGGYTKDEQEDFWNLSRYPGLISRLAREGDQSVEKIIAILKDYPAEIRQTGMEYGTNHYDVLRKMDAIQTKTDSAFDEILADYPSETQEALKELVQFPEIINLLNDHLGLTVRVGDRYRRNPQGVIHKADSLNLAEIRQNAIDAAAWKESIQSDPEAQDDLNKAGEDYATENGYTEDDVSAAPDPEYVDNYTCNPYPYWFGYPTWYPYDYWYPYPFWFDCGFYHDRHGHIVIIGSPSRYFTTWYFYRPEHVHRYPHLCDRYVDHYYGRGRNPGGNSRIVHNWVHQRKDYLPKDFTTNRTRRPEVIKQLASLDIDAQNKLGGKRLTPLARDDYYKGNETKYPALVNNPRPRPLATQDDGGDAIAQPEKQPPARIVRPMPVLGTDPGQIISRPQNRVDAEPVPTTTAPAVKPARTIDASEPNSGSTPPAPAPRPHISPQPVRQQSPQVDRPVSEPVVAPRPTPTYNFNTIHKAQEYQRNIWEQTQPAPRPQVQQAPRPQIQQQAPRPQPQQPARPAAPQPNRSRDK